MEEMVVRLKWDDEDLGKGWMNIDNLKLCLYTKNFTLEKLLEVEEVD